MRHWRSALFLTALFVAPIRPASACPNCKEAVAAQPAEAGEIKDGYNWSVLFMMAMPFALLGTGSFMVVRAVKRGAIPEM
ncbi:hypothetical protein [Singulisphaera sp. PoT]|uniref:hypothetical protein n=1 Tax=Singulisphaera sp. PoT TaxID=3411797 RepID=UPI003BF567A1